MPCWYFEKKELRNTPSFLDGIDPSTEARYRREGARFIIDAGTKMGLRYDTCGTGVVYFHRFYMFHSFKEFHRYITAACCLFLAGKVEETPKKCNNIIKICQALLSPQLFSVFGSDPKEEVMTMERILLQTIKFDLQVEHPYGQLLKFAKFVKGDKEKVQKLVQMAWTFINDSLCTTLCLQWEPEIISVSLMYLATRLTKFDIQDWQGKVPGSKQKWWDYLVEDITVDLMEDICHKVLDLYSSNPQNREESPPMTPSKKLARDTPPPPPPQVKKSRPNTPLDIVLDSKAQKLENDPNPKELKSSERRGKKLPPAPETTMPTSTAPMSMPPTGYTAPPGVPKSDFNQYNPYMSSQMYSSSFLSQEGSKSIQTLMSGGSGGGRDQPSYHQPPAAPPPQAPGVGQYPPTGQYPSQPPYQQPSYLPPTTAQYQPPPGQPPFQGQPGSFPPQNYPPPQTYPPDASQGQNFPPQAGNFPPQHQQPGYSYGNTPGFPPQVVAPGQGPYSGRPPPVPQHHQMPNPGAPGIAPTTPQGPMGPRIPLQKQPPSANKSSGLATVRITGRR